MSANIFRLFIGVGAYIYRLARIASKCTAVFAAAIAFPFPALSQTAPSSVVEYPRQYCHVLQRTTADAIPGVIEDFYSNLKKQPRWDILCIGDSIRLESQIRSNGGDVIIFANTFHVASTIDSRVYFSPDDISPYKKDFPINQGSYPSQLALAQPGSSLRMVYDDYYRRAPDAIKISNKTYLPELPSGVTGNTERSCEPPSQYFFDHVPKSTGAPDFSDRESTRSGRIVIFANTITFDDVALSKYSLFDGDPLDCQAVTTNVSGKAFISRGPRGGRGGAGATLAAFNLGGCVESSYQRSGFENVAGGRGGDGGSISVYLISNQNGNQRNEIQQRSAFEGGPTGSYKKLVAPSWRGPNAAPSADACGFLDRGNWPKASSGTPGALDIKSVTSTEAMAELAREIGSRDARPDYNLEELIGRAKLPAEKVKAFTFNGFAERAFYTVLINAQLAWLERLNTLIATGRENSSPVLGEAWSKLNFSNLDDSAISNEAAQPLRMLSGFANIRGHGPVKSYFYNSGGLLNVRTSRAVNQWEALASRTEATLSAAKLDQIQGTLTEIANGVNDIRAVVRSNEYRQSISELQLQLQQVKAAADAASASHSMTNVLDGVRTFGEGVVSLYAAYQTGEAALAGNGIIKIQEGIEKLSEATSGLDDLSPEINRLKSQIAQLRQDHEEFLRYSSEVKKRILSEQRQSLVDYFETNTSYGARLQSRSVLFHDLLRIILIGSRYDRSESKIELRTNLVSLFTLLKDYPSREPPMSFRDINIACSPNSDFDRICRDTVPSANWTALISTSNNWTKSLPLYVLAPSPRRISLPDYGLDWTTEVIVGEAQAEMDGISDRTLSGERLLKK